MYIVGALISTYLHFLKLSTQSRRCLRRLAYTIFKLMELIPTAHICQQNETDLKHMSNNVTTKQHMEWTEINVYVISTHYQLILQ